MFQAKIRKMLHDDLRDVVHGDLVTDPVWLSAFATDSSIWEQMPSAAVCPLDETDLQAVLCYAAEQKISVHPRGAGLGVTGESLGRGIVLDMSQNFRRVIEIGHDSITVESGTTIADVRACLAQIGRNLPGAPTDMGQMTIGGWLSGLGPGSAEFGQNSPSSVKKIRMALADGSIVTLQSLRQDWIRPDLESDHYLTAIQRIVNWRRDLFEETTRNPLIDKAGLQLSGVLDEQSGWIHPQFLVCGSRGSLGTILEATFSTLPRKTWSAFVTIGFDLSERATDAAGNLPHLSLIASVEVIDWRTAALASDASSSIGSFFPLPTPSTLCLRWDCDDEETARSIIQDTKDRFAQKAAYVRAEAFSGHNHPLNHWRSSTRLALAKRPSAMLGRPVFEEIVVHPERVSGIISQIAGVSQAARINASWVISPLSGRIQIEPLLEKKQAIDLEQVGRWVHSIVEIVAASGGVVRGVEPWIGRVRGSAISRQYADWISIWREIKAAFDSESRFNPNALPGEARPDIEARLLSIPKNLMEKGPQKASAQSMISDSEKYDESTIDRFPSLPVLEPELHWPEDRGPQVVASACNSCGACRSTDPALRMCPSFRGDYRESSTPRSLSGLVRQITSGTLDPTLWGSEHLKEVAESCFHCQMCKSECQAGIDISGLMIEAKSAAVQNYGLSHKDFWLSRVDILARMSSYFPVIANAILSHGQSRWVLEKVTGLSRFRRLPRVRRWSFLHRADSRGWCRMRPQAPGPRVALFLDILANHFHQDLAETTVEFLKFSGVNVYIPYRQTSSGMPALVVGDLDRARELVRTNLRVLGDAVRNGYTIVCIEPTSAMVLRDFYPRLTDDLDARLVADNTLELSTYLSGMADRGLLAEARHKLGGRIGYHQPCHQRALNVGHPGLDLVRKLPGISVDFIDRGCSGIAGPFGFSRSNFRKSLRIGHQLRARLKDDDIDVGMTECLSCRMQMEQGIPKRTHHPVEILALAAGLNPKLRSHWDHSKAKNLIT